MELAPPADRRPDDDQPRQPESEHHDYWTEVPWFKQMWTEHVERWPDGPAATVDRSKDTPGSWRSDSNFLLSPEAHERTKDAIHRIHESEPRVSDDFCAAVQESVPSAEAAGFEFRLKGEGRLKEKVAERLRYEPDRTPEDVVQGVHDAIRYTVCLSDEDYVSGYQDISLRLSDRGYTMYHSENHWEDSEYKGINTRWMTPEGQRFELQFHTAESYHAKQEITHKAYERIRNRLTSDNERAELEAFERAVSSWVSVPHGATEIPDYN